MSDESSMDAQAEVVRRTLTVTAIGLAVNVALSALKLAAGLLGHSQVIVADAVHSLSDVSTDVAVIVGVRQWSKPPDDAHPHGHGRIESLVTAVIGAALGAAAVGLTWHALATLRDPHDMRPGLIALGAALVSIVTKEALYRWTRDVGRRIGSTAVVANAWHHRSDALSSVPAALAVLAARLHPRWLFLDHLGALVVSVFIFRAGVMVAWPALKELVDVGVPEQELEQIRRMVLETPRVRRVHAIRTRLVAGRVYVDLHVLVDPQMSVREGHAVSEEVKQRLLLRGTRLRDVVVHLEPDDADGDDDG